MRGLRVEAGVSRARYIVGDAIEVLRLMPDASVDLVLSSPPFLALRSYLPPGHPDKAKEVGSEPNPGEFIDVLLDVTEECRRVLAPHGSLCFELGDTYSGSGGAGGDYNEGGLRDGQKKVDGSARRAKNKAGAGWPLEKSLTLVPELFRFALVYGTNPLTGRETERWRIRNVIRWCRPNPAPGALADKFRPATSEMVVACTSRRRYFDSDAVRAAPKNGLAPDKPVGEGLYRGHPKESGSASRPDRVSNIAGTPPLDWWEISTEPYQGSHYATWPSALLVKPILAMCPQRVCTVCGRPSERIVDVEHTANRSTNGPQSKARRKYSPGYAVRADRVSQILGWTDCGHDWRNGVVLDPFAGTGTTLAVATGHGRDAIGIDLDGRNAHLARERVGMWLEVEHFAREVVT